MATKIILSQDTQFFPTSSQTTTSTAAYKPINHFFSQPIPAAGVSFGANRINKREISNIAFLEPLSVQLKNTYEPSQGIGRWEDARIISLRARQDRVHLDEKRYRNFTTTAEASYTPKKATPSVPANPKTTTNIPFGDETDSISRNGSLASSSFIPYSRDEYKVPQRYNHYVSSNVIKGDSNSTITCSNNTLVYVQHPLSKSSQDNVHKEKNKSSSAFGVHFDGNFGTSAMKDDFKTPTDFKTAHKISPILNANLIKWADEGVTRESTHSSDYKEFKNVTHCINHVDTLKSSIPNGDVKVFNNTLNKSINATCFKPHGFIQREEIVTYKPSVISFGSNDREFNTTSNDAFTLHQVEKIKQAGHYERHLKSTSPFESSLKNFGGSSEMSDKFKNPNGVRPERRKGREVVKNKFLFPVTNKRE